MNAVLPASSWANGDGPSLDRIGKAVIRGTPPVNRDHACSRVCPG